MITSERKAIEYLEQGFKLEECQEFKRRFYYLTNRKDTEITVSKSIILKLKEKKIITSDNDYRPNNKLL